MGNPVTNKILTGTTPTWDTLYKFAQITAEGNVSMTLSGATTPDCGILHFKQDATGSRTLTIGGVAVEVDPAAGAVTRVEWTYDGTDYVFTTSYGQASSSLTKLSTPILTLSVQGADSIKADWTNVANETGYEVDIATNASFTLNKQTVSKGADVLTHTFTGLTASTVYYVRVKALADGVSYSDSNYDSDTATTAAAGSSYDADAQAYFSAVEATGATISSADKTAWDNFVTGAKSAGYWSDMLVLAPNLGGTAAAHGINAKTPGTLNPTWNLCSHNASGVGFNGTSSYGSTGVVPATVFTGGHFHLSYYTKDYSTAGAMISCSQSGGQSMRLERGGAVYFADFYGDGAGRIIATSVAGTAGGFFLGDRAPDNSGAVYYNGTSQATDAAGGGTAPTIELNVGRINDGASGSNYHTSQCGFLSIGYGLGATKAATFSADVQTLMTALGRQA
jgi:hypothetical protein